MGDNLHDDHKARIGGQMLAYQKDKFDVSAKAYGNFRRHETSLVRMASFGSNYSL